MLDSERTFKKRGQLEQFSKFCLRQQSFAFKEFCMETRLSNIFKTTNITNLTKVIQESYYRVLQVTSKQKTLKQPLYFLKAVEFCSTFDIQIGITLAIFWEKLQNYTFQKTHRSLSKHANIHINRAFHYEITALQKYEKFEFLLAAPSFKKSRLTFAIFNESKFGQRFIIFAKLKY